MIPARGQRKGPNFKIIDTPADLRRTKQCLLPTPATTHSISLVVVGSVIPHSFHLPLLFFFAFNFDFLFSIFYFLFSIRFVMFLLSPVFQFIYILRSQIHNGNLESVWRKLRYLSSRLKFSQTYAVKAAKKDEFPRGGSRQDTDRIIDRQQNKQNNIAVRSCIRLGAYITPVFWAKRRVLCKGTRRSFFFKKKECT
jgi:hypothetical protein